ncbi:hypothetical protein KFL_002910080 [Klebsormidium nitens]|uniref:Uncharacterized protein n=1 Tax=Klebsormidium nitens TaxID=105231 RepID=A0A1Y1I691_KLENI|nr:hypothetical protein KFL_002910080 [Klebsormidium nitens]|eukprot:GAQ86470.1 hypothetical protein KFL_002910080 [Klebsormidium nitens]
MNGCGHSKASGKALGARTRRSLTSSTRIRVLMSQARRLRLGWQSIDSFYQSPQDVTAPPPTRRGTHYYRPRSAPTITKSRRRAGTRKVTGGDGDDDPGYDEQLPGGGDGGVFWSGGSGGSFGGSGGSGGRSGGKWGGGNWGGRGDRGGGKAGDESWGPGDGDESIDWSRLAGQWQTGGRMKQRSLDALCSLYYRSLCWISLTRCIHHVLRSQFCIFDGVAEGMNVGARPVLAHCSSVFESRLGNCRMVAAS